NTPRPTNTPRVAPPSIQVDPAPPNRASGSLIVFGENFAPNVRYTVNLDNAPTIESGLTSREGTIALTVSLPAGIQPGPHVVRVCVDCRPGGVSQEAVAAFLVANPAITPTATPQP